MCQCHLSYKSKANSGDFHLLGTHSCKTTRLSWSQQLHLSMEQRQMQGHHRPAGAGKSVALFHLYSRSDTLPALTLQMTIAQELAEPSIQDFTVQIPTWTPVRGILNSLPSKTLQGRSLPMRKAWMSGTRFNIKMTGSKLGSLWIDSLVLVARAIGPSRIIESISQRHGSHEILSINCSTCGAEPASTRDRMQRAVAQQSCAKPHLATAALQLYWIGRLGYGL